MAPKTVPISSANSTFQVIETLARNRKKRHQSGLFFVEGVKPINLALANGWAVESFCYSSGVTLSRWATDLLKSSMARFHYALAPHLMDELSDKEDTSEIIAIIRIPEDDLGRIPVAEDLLVLLLDRPSSPGNLGTIIRSCDAFGAGGLIVTGHSADLYDPQTIRASVGTLFAVPSVRTPSMTEVLPWLNDARRELCELQIIGSSAHAEKEPSEIDLTRPTVLVLGNETHGMSHGLREVCDSVVRIPIHGAASSLNVACAASILLYEIDKQRRTKIR